MRKGYGYKVIENPTIEDVINDDLHGDSLLEHMVYASQKVIDSEQPDEEFDSFYGLAKKINLYARASLNDNNTIEQRLDASFEVGKFHTMYRMYLIESKKNSKHRNKSRDWIELDEWTIEQIESGLTYKEIFNAIPESSVPEADTFYRDGEQVVFISDGIKSKKPMKKKYFVESYCTRIKKKYQKT